MSATVLHTAESFRPLDQADRGMGYRLSDELTNGNVIEFLFMLRDQGEDLIPGNPITVDSQLLQKEKTVQLRIPEADEFSGIFARYDRTNRFMYVWMPDRPYQAMSIHSIREVTAEGGGAGLLVLAGLPTPGEDYLNRVVVNQFDRKEYICQNDRFRTDHPVSTFESLENYYTTGSAHLTVIHHQFPQAAAAIEGRYYYDTYDNTFYRAVEFSTGNYGFRQVGAAEALREVCHAYYAALEGGELPGDDATQVVYLGEGHDDDNVTEVILPQHTVDLTTRYYVYYNFISNEFEILTDYTPANGLIDHYVWNPVRAEAFNPILRPLAGGAFPQPTEELFQAHALLVDFNAHNWHLENSLRVGQSERAVFAPFESNPNAAAAARGWEILTPWASGVDYLVGDRVSAGVGPAAFTVCIQAHTSTVGGATGDPDDENDGYDAYWETVEAYAQRLQVPNRGHFRGVVHNVNDVSNPQVDDWIAAPHGSGGVEFRMYEVHRGLFGAAAAWVTAHPFPHVLGAFQDEAAARRAIRNFDSSTRTVALINGQLRELTYYAGRTMDTHVLEWVQSSSGANPVAVFYGRSMSAAGGRWQEAAAGNKEDEGDDRLLRWEDDPRETYFHGGAFASAFTFHAPGDVTGEDATVTASDILFSPPPGIYNVELGAGTEQADQADAALGLFQVLSGTADDQARALVTPGSSNVASTLGEPDLEMAATAGRKLLQVHDGDVFLAIFKGIAGNTSQYMLWEKLD